MDTTAPTEPDQFEPIDWTVIGHNIIIEFEEDAAERTSAGGVIIPGTKREVRKSVATVVGVGPYAALDIRPPMPPDPSIEKPELGWQQRHVQVGDTLVVHRHKLTKLELEADGDRKLWVIDPTNVIGIIDTPVEPQAEQG